MGYFSEIMRAWRPLLAAMLGLATGNSIVGVITSAIAPALIADAGWTKAQFALIGSLTLLTALVLPFIGRLADSIGVRKTAAIGLVTIPLVNLAYSVWGASLASYIAIYLVQTTVCVTTTAMVFTRLVVRHVSKVRGLALAIVASSPAVAGMIIGPILNGYVEVHGWQATFRALALCLAGTGVLTYWLIPSDSPARHDDQVSRLRASGAYREILAAPAFWILAISMMLCNLPMTLLLTQLKILVMDQGITGPGAAVMFSALSFGMLFGRIIAGLALDKFRPHIVACVALGIPAFGLFLLATPYDASSVVALAIFLLGFAFGAEGDAVAFLVARHFAIAVYSSVMGLLTAIMSFSTAAGAAALSFTLSKTGSFNPFLLATGTLVLFGAVLLLRLKRCEIPNPGST